MNLAFACFVLALIWYLTSGLMLKPMTRRKDRVRTVVFFALLGVGLAASILSVVAG